MRLIRDPAAMRELAEDRRRDGRRIALVPTMGFLHEGHLSLLRAGRARSDVLVLSIFVNPTQFGEGEDLDRYPRDEDGDLAVAAECNTDVAFCPAPGAMYTGGYQTHVEVTALAEPLCGARRPGHFRGVASMVTKLFNITRPHVAVFGEKDFQQLAVIRRLVTDLDFGIEIVGMPIVREPDGLAMSSRNRYLSADEREQALGLSRGLERARQLVAGGERDGAVLVAACVREVESAPAAQIDYIELRDTRTLETVEELSRPAVLAVAARFGETRLIDNAVLAPA